MKEDTRVEGPFEAGVFRESAQGERSDLGEAIQTLTDTRSVSAVAAAHPVQFVRYHRGFEALYSRTQPRRTTAPTVILLYGKTGAGKTRYAFEQDPALYRKVPQTRWFDGYEGQDTLLLDDFSGASSKLSLDYLLQLLDRYPIDVEVKGGYRPLLATVIYITTNNHPRTWYDYTRREEQYRALARRVHRVIYFGLEESVEVNRLVFWEDWSANSNEEELFQATRPNTPQVDED